MLKRLFLRALVLMFIGGTLLAGFAQTRPDSAAIIEAQRQSMKPLASIDGVWRGSAWTILASGDKHTITQTERIGPFLDGSVKVIEGRGYDADGTVSFNAFGTISYKELKTAIAAGVVVLEIRLCHR